LVLLRAFEQNGASWSFVPVNLDLYESPLGTCSLNGEYLLNISESDLNLQMKILVLGVVLNGDAIQLADAQVGGIFHGGGKFVAAPYLERSLMFPFWELGSFMFHFRYFY